MDEKKPNAKDAAKDKDAKKEVEKPAEGGAPAKGNKGLFFGIIAGVIVLELVLAYVLVTMTMPRPAGEVAGGHHADTANVHDESTMMGETTAETPIEVIVNIAGTEGERFLKAAVVLEYENHAEVKGGGGGHGHGGGSTLTPMGEAIQKRIPKYKSYLIETLTRMTLSEITTPDAKEKIRKDLLRVVNGTVPPELGIVKDIYFTQFIIQ